MCRKIQRLSKRIQELNNEKAFSKSTIEKDKQTIQELLQKVRVLRIGAKGDKKTIKKMSKRIERTNDK